MNSLLAFKTLNNRYFVMRHGQSMANREGLIVSTPENGIESYGLSDEGRLQAEHSIVESNTLDDTVQIISSDFKRARETAEIVQKLLNTTQKLVLDERLRERDFGDFELTSNVNYQTVWDNDAINSAHTLDNAESADSVMNRATSLVASLERGFKGMMFLLVAHGDTLQILQTAFQKLSATKQRELKHLETAEIRELFYAVES